MKALIDRIDGIIKELNRIKKVVKTYAELKDMEELPKKWEHKQYILYDKDGNVVMRGNQTQVRDVAGMSGVKFKKMLEDGSAYNGYTIDEEYEDELI